MDSECIVIVNSDASLTQIDDINSVNGRYFLTDLPEHLSNENIFVLEMKAFEKALESWGPLSNTHFIGLIDNVTAGGAINKDFSKDPKVARRARNLIADENNNYYNSCWIGTKRNFMSDCLQRKVVDLALGYAYNGIPIDVCLPFASVVKDIAHT